MLALSHNAKKFKFYDNFDSFQLLDLNLNSYKPTDMSQIRISQYPHNRQMNRFYSEACMN